MTPKTPVFTRILCKKPTQIQFCAY